MYHFAPLAPARLTAMQSMSVSLKVGRGEVIPPTMARSAVRSSSRSTTQNGMKPTMSIIEQIQRQQAEQRDALLAELDTVTKAAAEATEKGAGARAWAEQVGAVLDILQWADAKDRAGKAVAKYLTDAKSALDALGGVDRLDGDLLASTLLAGVIGLGSESPELVAKVNSAVAAWQATAPSSKRSGGGRGAVDHSKPGTRWQCSCGATSEDRSNPNSAKSGYMGHLIAKNGHGFTSKPTGDNPANAIIGKAFQDAWSAKDSKQSFTSTQFSAPDGNLYQVTVKWFDGEGAPVQVDAEKPEEEAAA